MTDRNQVIHSAFCGVLTTKWLAKAVARKRLNCLREKSSFLLMSGVRRTTTTLQYHKQCTVFAIELFWVVSVTLFRFVVVSGFREGLASWWGIREGLESEMQSVPNVLIAEACSHMVYTYIYGVYLYMCSIFLYIHSITYGDRMNRRQWRQFINIRHEMPCKLSLL